MSILSFPVKVSNILEHHRTIRGGKDTLGQVYTETVNLGWFLHLELPDGEPFGVALGLGNDPPDGVAIGEISSTLIEESMTEHYLIAHKVRGEPAFDIAINIGSEVDGDLWIIPTSGHRAFPYWWCPMSDLLVKDSPYSPEETIKCYNIPDNLRDHYYCNDAPTRKARSVEPELESLA